MKEHLLVSDYDGTFYTSDQNIDINLKAIEEFRKNGGLFLLNTGRSFSSIKGKIRKYNIKYDYLACLDGLSTYDIDDEVVDFSELDYSNDDLIEDIRKFKLNDFSVHYLKDVYSPIIEKSFTCMNHDRLNHRLSKLLGSKYQNIDVNMYIINSMIYYFIRNRNINKSRPIQVILDIKQINPKNVFTIGDELNDLAMIREYNGYVMGDGNMDLSKHAIGSYEHVYQLIEDIKQEKVKRR